MCDKKGEAEYYGPTYYTKQEFYDKAPYVYKRAGEHCMEMALILHFIAEQKFCKNLAIVMGALGYFICTFDMIPDFLPFVGYIDDARVMTAAVAAVRSCIDEEVMQQVRGCMEYWFKSKKK